MTATRHVFGHAVLVCRAEEWDYSVTAHPDAAPADVAQALACAEKLGLEPVPDADPEALPDGSVRMWLHPIDPFANDPFETEILCTSSN
ncbi:hypothetical protein [Streptomyces sp. NPDC059009]|uniref:hypothetical protein n=1 Tax=Streptomyces sp. NPDC059009 TaxID=3346694 RepID=UPI0036C414B0